MPKRIMALYALVGLQIFSCAFIIALAIVSSAVHFEEGFGRGLQDSLCRFAEIERIEDFDANRVGYVVGKLLIPMILLGMASSGIANRRRMRVAIAMTLLMLVQLGQGGLPVLSFLCLVLLILPRSSRVWQRPETYTEVAA